MTKKDADTQTEDEALEEEELEQVAGGGVEPSPFMPHKPTLNPIEKSRDLGGGPEKIQRDLGGGGDNKIQ